MNVTVNNPVFFLIRAVPSSTSSPHSSVDTATATMPAEYRHPYEALTPVEADYALSSRPWAGSSDSINTFSLSGASDALTKTRLQSLLDRFHDFVSLNAGLLFVTAASAVFSVVNLAVKVVQTLGEPVTTAEVCRFEFVVRDSRA